MSLLPCTHRQTARFFRLNQQGLPRIEFVDASYGFANSKVDSVHLSPETFEYHKKRTQDSGLFPILEDPDQEGVFWKTEIKPRIEQRSKNYIAQLSTNSGGRLTFN